MSRCYPSSPIVGVGAVIVRNIGGRPEVLLARRANPPLAGEWSLPGGALELGAKLREGVAREVLEETGLEVEVGPVLDVIDSIFPDREGRTEYHYVLIDFLCRVTGGDLCAGGDAADVAWASENELEKYKLEKPARDVIGKAFLRERGEPTTEAQRHGA